MVTQAVSVVCAPRNAAKSQYVKSFFRGRWPTILVSDLRAHDRFAFGRDGKPRLAEPDQPARGALRALARSPRRVSGQVVDVKTPKTPALGVHDPHRSLREFEAPTVEVEVHRVAPLQREREFGHLVSDLPIHGRDAIPARHPLGEQRHHLPRDDPGVVRRPQAFPGMTAGGCTPPSGWKAR